MKRKQMIFAALIAVSLLLGACGGTGAKTQGKPTSVGRIGGLSANLTLRQRAYVSDLIIRGTPISDTVHRFTENGAIPESAKQEKLYQTAGYHDVVIQVAEYLKGSGPTTLSVRRLASIGGVGIEDAAPVPALDKEQVMLLFQGTGVFVGGYLILGPEGLGKVFDNDLLSFPSGTTLSLDELRQAIATAEKPPYYNGK
jgi:hypothetical protein